MSKLVIVGDYNFVFPETKPEDLLMEAIVSHGFLDAEVDYEVDAQTGKISGFAISTRASRFIDVLCIEQSLTVGEPDNPVLFPRNIAVIVNPKKAYEYTLLISVGCEFVDWDTALASVAGVLRKATPFWTIQHDPLEARHAFLAAIERGNQITEQVKFGTARFS